MSGLTGASQNDSAASWMVLLLRRLCGGLAGMGRPRDERRLELIETLALGGKRQLLLVLCDGQRVLVGAGGDSVHSIVEIEAPAEMGCGACGMNEGLRAKKQGARCN